MVGVVIIKADKFTKLELEKLYKSRDVLEKVLNSDEFKQRVLTSKFTYTDKTAQAIYDDIMGGDEIINGRRTGKNGIWEIDIQIYNSGWFGRGVVGYTYPYTLTTWINRRFYSWFKDYEAAGNIAHEKMHKLGYGHPFNRTSTRDDSVPYKIGFIVDELGSKYAS